ncbi:PIKK family atypical protein kinase [Tritrichomonas foetus]|uniref:Serine/threonine-protein kinase TOR n=1 Tax=Tritrichomonas foetus TaxID=1144522 RepID=A0A1J4KQV1_9EUKA|nr:PIKK family atypical protein kinase [Tritrichomonas foetus]|eukprot:OHT13665.1 PIKK family atypical protein kinase [Tritrichomonas foetus]
MNVSSLPVPSTCAEMIKAYEDYYHVFYLEMVRMSNSNFNSYVQNYIDLIRQMVKSTSPPNKIRAAIGIISLHVFGYDNFDQLIRLFDCLLPQVDLEYVKFTSWCSGTLIHHPGIEQSRYFSHLFVRLCGWASSRGRRARYLAAAHMINALAISAGSNVVVFYPTLQSIIWLLVSHESSQVLKATAEAVYNFAIAVIRYARSDFNEFMTFFFQVASKLLSFGDSIRAYAALLLFKGLINASPEFFNSKFLMLYSIIVEDEEDKPLLVRNSAYQVICSLSQVDPVGFVNNFAEEVLERTDELIVEFPSEVVESLCLLLRTIPDFLFSRLNDLRKFVDDLVSISFSPFLLLTTMFKAFKEAVLPLDNNLIYKLINYPITEDFQEFIITSCSYLKSPSFNSQLSKRLLEELKKTNPLLTLNILANVPPEVLVDKEELLKAIDSISSPNLPTRQAAPKAIFNVARQCEKVSFNELIERLFHVVLYDSSLDVRAAALNVLYENVDKSFASPANMKFIQVFVNDDAVTVRRIALRILAKLVPFNPVGVASITRSAMLDVFFVIRRVPSIRQRSRVARILPDLVRASEKTITVYSEGFMDVAIEAFKKHDEIMRNKDYFANFLEVRSYYRFLIGIINALAILAPLDPPQVAKHADILIEFLCSVLAPENNRNLLLSILDLLFVLLRPPASNVLYRAKAPLIMSSCSSLLATTDSRKERMALLKVIGALGVLEVHQNRLPIARTSPPNIEESITKQFFHPGDNEDFIDDSWLIQDELHEQYEAVFSAGSVLEIFADDTLKEFHEEAVQALVNILALPNVSLLAQLDSFVTRLLDVLRTCNISELKTYMPLFATLVQNCKSDITPFIKESLEIIIEKFCPELALEFITVILAFLNSVKDAFSPYASQAICLLIGCLDNSKTCDAYLSKSVLNAFSSLGIYASDLLYLIVPQICDAIECEQSLPKVRVLAFQTLSNLMRSVDLFHYLGPIMRALTYGLFHSDEKTVRASFEFLYVILKTQGSNFIKSAEPVINTIRVCHMETKELNEIINDVQKGVYSDRYKPLPVSKKATKKQTRAANANIIFSEEAITMKAMTPSIGREQHLEQWLTSFMLTIINNSPSPSIRACTTLATNYSPLANKLFCVAFLSCWRLLSDKAKSQITKSFSDLLTASGTYDTVNHEIIRLLFFMDKVEKPIGIEIESLLQSSIRYGGAAFALHLVDREYENNPEDVKRASLIIDLYARLGSWPNAIGTWEKSRMKYSTLFQNQLEILTKLRMWDQVEPSHREKFFRVKDFGSFCGLTQSLASLANWEEIMKFYETFKNLKIHQKLQVSSYFAEAAMKLGQWDTLNDILQYSPEDSFICKMMAAMMALHNHENDSVENFIEEGFSLIASRPINFISDNQQVHQETILQCQKLVEILEMTHWNKNEYRAQIEEVWNERLKTAPRDFDLWFGILSNRINFTRIIDTNLIKFFSMKSATLGTKLHNNAFESLFPSFRLDDTLSYDNSKLMDTINSPDLVKVCSVVAHWNTGEKSRALEEMDSLIRVLSGSLLHECLFIYSNWILDFNNDSYDTLQTAYKCLKRIITDTSPSGKPVYNDPSSPIGDNKSMIRMRRHTSETLNGLILPVQSFRDLLASSTTINVEIIRKWADVNFALSNIDKGGSTSYVTNSIDGLTKCISMRPSFPDIVLLLNIFFEHAGKFEVFNSTAHKCIETLPPKLLLQASPQLLVQLSHNSQNVSNFVHAIVNELLTEHFHELIFSIIVLTKSPNLNRSMAANDIIDEFTVTHPREYVEVILIRKCLLRAAVTMSENMLTLVSDSIDHIRHNKLNKMRTKLSQVTKLIKPERAKCPMDRDFQKSHHDEILKLEKLLQEISFSTTKDNSTSNNMVNNITSNNMNYDNTTNNVNGVVNGVTSSKVDNKESNIEKLLEWCRNNQNILTEELKNIRTIQMSAISPELFRRSDFLLSVFGTYKPFKPVNRIEYFVGQFKVYMSKQQPKDVVVKGSDGKFYQYLLKGHEDLRLDERIMQFFRLINSLLSKESCFEGNSIQTICVIPLSHSHGLVQWVPGTETLRNIVEDYRRLHQIDPTREYEIANTLSVTNFDYLPPINKMQIIEKVFAEVPDNDIASSFWLKAGSAEAWFKKTNSFSISTAITSIVGYVIGLGDRHPSNLLIDRSNGKVVHIDFGDCFERAMVRRLLPEVVPFRLTRMIVKAFGPSGVDGLFRSSFINMSNLLRENARVLVMVLSVFVHEPLSAPEEAGTSLDQASLNSSLETREMKPKDLIASSVEMRKRVMQKLTGSDFNENDRMSVEEQASKLIESATNTYNLSRMYSGWCPFW